MYHRALAASTCIGEFQITGDANSNFGTAASRRISLFILLLWMLLWTPESQESGEGPARGRQCTSQQGRRIQREDVPPMHPAQRSLTVCRRSCTVRSSQEISPILLARAVSPSSSASASLAASVNSVSSVVDKTASELIGLLDHDDVLAEDWIFLVCEREG